MLPRICTQSSLFFYGLVNPSFNCCNLQRCILDFRIAKANKMKHSWRDKILRFPHVSPTNTIQHSFWFCFSRWKYCYPSALTTHTWCPATTTEISWKLQMLPKKNFPKLYQTLLVPFFFAWPLLYSTELLCWSFFLIQHFYAEDMSETCWAIEAVGLYTMIVKKRVYDNPLVSSCGVTRRRNYYWKALLIPKVKKNILLLKQKNMKCIYINLYLAIL